MADIIIKTPANTTRFSAVEAKLKTFPDVNGNLFPTDVPPYGGDAFFDTNNNCVWVYNDLKGQWMYMQLSTTTSTSTSTTTTTTSTTTTSTSTSTTTSTSTSTTTSTTTTL